MLKAGCFIPNANAVFPLRHKHPTSSILPVSLSPRFMTWCPYRSLVFSCWILSELIQAPHLTAVTTLQAFLVPSIDISINEHIAATPRASIYFTHRHIYHPLRPGDSILPKAYFDFTSITRRETEPNVRTFLPPLTQPLAPPTAATLTAARSEPAT